MSNFKDLTGQRFGKLTVIKRIENNKHNQAQWLCRCDCGGETITTSAHLKSGHSKSCGCLIKETVIKRCTKHNKNDTRLYKVWKNIKMRCYNENLPQYKYYGGRGIIMCNEWKNNFQTFYNWAINNGYNENAERYKCTIDRIDKNGNYEPNNCRWVNMKIQMNNTRRNYLITYKNETHTLPEWAEIAGLKNKLIYDRLEKLNWDIEKALTTPARKNKNKKDNE